MEPNDPWGVADAADSDESLPLRELRRLAGGACVDCRTGYPARDAVFSVALGFKNAPRCLTCLGRRLTRDRDELHRQLVDYVLRRDCYRKAWVEAGRMDGTGDEPTAAVTDAPLGSEGGVPAADSWDAGDLGCGELVMELRLRLARLAPGSVLRVTATDPAAPEDLPAWCRLCGHTLAAMDHPHYFIQRKGT